MADAAVTNRGLNNLLTDPVEQGDEFFKLPSTLQNEQVQGWPDFSTSALFLDTVRGPTTKKPQEGDRKSGSFTLSDDAWHHVDWDPEVGAIELWPIPASSTDGIEITTNPAAAANAGAEIAANQRFEVLVAGAPVGRFYVRRTAAGNGGNGSVNVNVNFICHGTQKMLDATNRNANETHA